MTDIPMTPRLAKALEAWAEFIESLSGQPVVPENPVTDLLAAISEAQNHRADDSPDY